ncbi:S1 RNA-binding domain-containing protein [Paenibacillus dendritiformis]|uniref:S1 RNA-binding domain-containing protein n=1 Tax=Paenibacillus dendritiformis TaxID=130049 RepID=UPI001F5587F2|nr:S1 RNA-binding domain-containing protein [Paenibacillus dendritiformis]
MSEELKRVLIEGFQEEKVLHREYDEGWAQIYSARQNDLILQSELIGLEPKLNKLCGVVMVGGVRGYIPQEFSGTTDAHAFRRLLGEPVAFKIVNYDREGDTFIASRQAALEHMEGLTWKWLEPDAVITGVVRTVLPKLLTLDIGGITVELPVQEYSYGWIDDLREEVNIGDHLKVKVVELDKENKVVKVSKKAAEKSPWPDCTKRYIAKGTYKGKVSGVMEYGIFVNLERGVDALVPHIRFGKVKRGDIVYVRVRGVDPKQERIYGRIVPRR